MVTPSRFGSLVGGVVIRSALVGSLLVVSLVACGGDDDDVPSAAESSTTVDSSASPASSSPAPASTSDSDCGVTLAEVQELLPPTSGVSENSTPDPGRCNFTWDDGGPRGIDVVIVPGGRAAFEVPAGYEPLDGYGDEAYTSTIPGQANAFAFVGDDLYAADVVIDGATGPGAAEADLLDLCLQLLALTLD
jgi:hypothetical protein